MPRTGKMKSRPTTSKRSLIGTTFSGGKTALPPKAGGLGVPKATVTKTASAPRQGGVGTSLPYVQPVTVKKAPRR